MRIRLILAIWICKLAIFASRLLGKKGTSAPGRLALLICPEILTRLSRQVKKEIIVVCGTNGKTTTNNLLASFIRSKGYQVVCNHVGANMLDGVCCTFAENAGLFGKLKADYACLEVDEASCVKVFQHLKPTTVVVTNLFRDQLDRYGEISLTVDFILRALDMAPEAKLVVNGDDPLVAQFGEEKDRKCYYIGVDEDTGTGESGTAEGRFCSFCGAKLQYDYYHYSQLGKFHCTGCDFARRELDFRVHHVTLSNGLSFSLDYRNKTDMFSVPYRGFYNIYNIVLSFAAAVVVMDAVPDYERVLSAYQPQTGRMEEFNIGRPVILNLAKNPAGFNQAIAAVLSDANEKDILLAVNDYPNDGLDISWLWDVNFEKLQNAGVDRLVVSGRRADELMLRLKYAGFGEDSQIKCHDLKQAAKAAVLGEAAVCYVLANYSAVFPMQEILKEMESEAGHHA